MGPHLPSHNFFIFVQIGIKIKRFFRSNRSGLRDICKFHTPLSHGILSRFPLPSAICYLKQYMLNEDRSSTVFQGQIDSKEEFLTPCSPLELSITELITLLEIPSVDGGNLNR